MVKEASNLRPDQTPRSPAGILGRRAVMVHPCWDKALPTMNRISRKWEGWKP